MNPETPRGMGRLNLRLLRGAIQYGEEVEADEVHDALLLRKRSLAPELIAEHAGRGQLGREPAPGSRTASEGWLSGKQVVGFQRHVYGARLRRGAPARQASCRRQRSHTCSAAETFP